MRSEQFALTWNDFQERVSTSFKKLRIEKDLFDVTLISDDEEQILAHKLLLSACSSFFKSILKKSSNTTHPLIYLSGIDSRNLNMIVDYIYQGEVQIYQDQLDKFLEVAHRLKVEDLLSSNEHLSDLKEENIDPYHEQQIQRNKDNSCIPKNQHEELFSFKHEDAEVISWNLT